jgi:hypothetical protein
VPAPGLAAAGGGPGAADVLKRPAGLVFVDRESTLLAPPECDLWALVQTDNIEVDDLVTRSLQRRVLDIGIMTAECERPAFGHHED